MTASYSLKKASLLLNFLTGRLKRRVAGILWGLSLHLHMGSLETQKCNFYTPYMLLLLLHSGVSRYCLIHFSLFKKIQLAFFTTKKEPLWPFFLLLRHIHLTQRTSPITTPFFSKLSIAFENFLFHWEKSYKQFPPLLTVLQCKEYSITQ